MREQAIEALKAVLDPELGVNIVDLGLVERLDADESGILIDLIMTSPACPQGDYLAEQCTQVMEQSFGANLPVSVQVVSFPPWEPERMSESARRQLGWIG